MPAVITLGHVLIMLALVALLTAVGSIVTAMRHRGHGRGTPGYARARTARRHAAYALVVAIALGAGWLTPLGEMALVGGA